jgi:hypothetical protein
MKTLPLLAATCAFTLWGCAHDEAGDKPSMQAIENPTTQAQQGRLGAPTVYEGEATGGAGHAVMTSDGRIWAPEEAPGNTVVRTPSDVQQSIERHSSVKRGPEVNGASEVIDEGPTNEAPRQ